MQVTQKILRERFSYDGRDLRWKDCKITSKNGSVAGGINALGYRRICLGSNQYLAHRLIWLYVHGDLPDMLDHINRDKLDNRIENLRPADMALNVRNRGAYPSQTGIKGVYPFRGGYKACIQVGDKQYHLGTFSTIPEAKKARKDAEARYW